MISFGNGSSSNSSLVGTNDVTDLTNDNLDFERQVGAAAAATIVNIETESVNNSSNRKVIDNFTILYHFNFIFCFTIIRYQ